MTEEKRKQMIERLEKMSIGTLREHLSLSIKKQDELLELWMGFDVFEEELKEEIFDYAIEMERDDLIQTLITKGFKPTKHNKDYAFSCICKCSKEAEERTTKLYHIIEKAAES